MQRVLLSVVFGGSGAAACLLVGAFHWAPLYVFGFGLIGLLKYERPVLIGQSMVWVLVSWVIMGICAHLALPDAPGLAEIFRPGTLASIRLEMERDTQLGNALGLGLWILHAVALPRTEQAAPVRPEEMPDLPQSHHRDYLPD